MNTRGFTLVQLIVTIAIIGILLSVATLNFNTYTRKAQIEKETKELFTTIQTTRLAAIQKKQWTALLLGPNQYTFRTYSSSYQPIANGTAVSSGSYTYQVQKLSAANTLSPLNIASDYIQFDSRGYTTNTMTNAYSADLTLVVTPVTFSGAKDCILVQAGRTNMGSLQNDYTCQIR